MAWKTETKIVKGIQEIYGFNDKDPKNKKIVFKFLSSSKTIECYPQSRWFPLEKISLLGFKALPEEFNNRGLLKTKSALNAIQRIIRSLNIVNFIISIDDSTSLKKSKTGNQLVLKYEDLRGFIKVMKAANATTQSDMRIAADGFLSKLFPSALKIKVDTQKTRLSRLITSLDKSIISEMTGDDIESLINFTSDVVRERYVKEEFKAKLITEAKLKFDTVALKEVISEFEELLASPQTESIWGKFLKKNLFLVESRYVHMFEKLNVITATSREADFALVDTHGFLDIFEIKTPETKLLAAGDDRGNFFWHTEMTKATTQAEKYLYNAEQRAPILEKDIQRQLNTDVKVSRPRTVLIAGNSKQLDTPEKVEDFRVLRASLKNVEIVLYDELLQRLRNQMNKLGGYIKAK